MKKILLLLILTITYLSYANPVDSTKKSISIEPLPDQLFLIIDSTYSQDRPGQFWDVDNQNCFFQIKNGEFALVYQFRKDFKKYYGSSSNIKSSIEGDETVYCLIGGERVDAMTVKFKKVDNNTYVIILNKFREPERVLYAHKSTIEEQERVINFYK